MFFTVIDQKIPVSAPTATAFLRLDNWDDWGKYRTQFRLTVFDHGGQAHDIGNVKIGHFGLLPGALPGPNVRAPALSNTFNGLAQGYFSLGQDETYYEALNLLPTDLRLAVLKGLCDIAFDLDLFEKTASEIVMNESLLRDISSANVRNRFHRLAKGDATLTPFEFEYIFPIPMSSGMAPPPPLSFIVTPESVPPTNVHVLIGRNGVGKTHCMQNIGKSLLGVQDAEKPPGEIRALGGNQSDWSFAGLVSVSFSAFDDFDWPAPVHPGIAANVIGLRYKDPKTNEVRIKTPQDLASDFTKSFGLCRKGLRAERWGKAIQTLSNDPVFSDANALSLLELDDEKWEIEAREFFHKRLSSGHKIVLLTITRLVELVDERTLVLLDEPEGHLHPPLLSAFIRSLADLLVQRNGVAIVATHSPVVLQEVPQSCIWMLRRAGYNSIAEKPTLETFGENVGVLTREVFGLEVTSAGFHQLIREAALTKLLTYEQIVNHFGGQIGAEARAIARGLVANRDLKAPL